MKIAVTGATGFIGRYLVRHLIAAGHSVRAWHRASSDRSGFEQAGGALEWVLGDLDDPTSNEALVAKTDAVIHAALWRPGRGFRGAEGDLATFVDRNVLGSLRLIEASRGAKVAKFIYVSSCSVHERILDDRPLDETHPTWATSHYGAHKAAVEQFIYSYGLGDGYPICALRPCGVYGTAHPPTESKWFELVRDVVAGRKVICQRGGKEVHAADVAKACEVLLQAPAESIAGEAFNCCDRYVSEWEVAQLAKRFSQSDARIEGKQTSPKHEIVTSKLRGLGMEFGGPALLEETIAQLVTAASNRSVP